MSYDLASNLGLSDFSIVALRSIRSALKLVMTFASPNFVVAPRQEDGVQPEVASPVEEVVQSAVLAVASLSFEQQAEDWALALAESSKPSSKDVAKRVLLKMKIIGSFFVEKSLSITEDDERKK